MRWPAFFSGLSIRSHSLNSASIALRGKSSGQWAGVTHGRRVRLCQPATQPLPLNPNLAVAHLDREALEAEQGHGHTELLLRHGAAAVLVPLAEEVDDAHRLRRGRSVQVRGCVRRELETASGRQQAGAPAARVHRVAAVRKILRSSCRTRPQGGWTTRLLGARRHPL